MRLHSCVLRPAQSALFVCLAAASLCAWSQTQGVKRALLIGINTYQAVPSLSGSLNDVAAMREVLITRWGFDVRNVRTLTERDATRAGILSALQQLVREAGPNDVVYVHYSGHGSQVQDLNGDEEDGLDETLVPRDGRTPNVPDILDDELDAIFSKLRAGGALIVLDSCHSGTATRAVDIHTRSVPRDSRIDLYRSAATTARAIVPRVQARQIVMSGAAADQEALDGPVEGEDRGFFSYALSRSLAASSPNASPRTVFAGVEHELRRIQTQFGRTSMPEPQLEGPPALLDRPLLSAIDAAAAGQNVTSGARVAWLEVRQQNNGTITLINGTLLGAAPGSTWSLYQPRDTNFTPGRALAVATVLPTPAQSMSKDAPATVAPANVRLPEGTRAVMLMPAPGAGRIPIRISDVPPALRPQIESILTRTIRNLELAGPGAAARFLIDMRGNTLRLLAADGLQVVATFDAQTDQWGPAVARVVSRSASASELLALDNPTSRIRVSAQVMGAMPASRDIVLADTRPAPLHMRRPGEPRSAQNSLQLAITVNSDAYLTIVDVDSEGNANLLFPNVSQRPDFLPNGRVPAHVPLLIPDSLESGARAGFFWDYGPPAGLDTIRIFASTDLATARLIRDRIGAVRADLGALRLDLTGLATRGIVTVADTGPDAAAADWAAATLTVSVEE
jgi:caspase domain-containing protein/uncharacterized protein DUF4384